MIGNSPNLETTYSKTTGQFNGKLSIIFRKTVTAAK
ncbi:hypothetical protein T11_14537 [Trichinella zimbabwensis]|uniref:Uncharacterized protein n=1 Tax=Trichinella zimbabwensis TaxID=268475 RepID=A0A0V1GKQ0_9BILA|nr:hypothetical protein T11_17884 [Trichinella zimbabwensis]KRY98853.1 hypothetical protein T11_14537 [Trichinella zimbabwensis]